MNLAVDNAVSLIAMAKESGRSLAGNFRPWISGLYGALTVFVYCQMLKLSILARQLNY
jgi:hypothetical protein